MPAQKSAFLIGSFCDFPQSLQANAGIVHEIRPLSFAFASFLVHYFIIYLSFKPIKSAGTASLNKP
jgi:hypothetical protein